MDRDVLLEHARAAAHHAYAPFSRFRVGAALVVTDEQGAEHIIVGCNVENASFGLTMCAERDALAAAVSQFGVAPAGKPHVTAIAVACIDAPEDASAALRSPCGACRQWIAELAPQARIYIDGIADEYVLDDLLPFAFRLDER